ncbi:MAG: peptide ABC transporter substrate-binding protein [Verrucomicrobiota bacterium]
MWKHSWPPLIVSCLVLGLIACGPSEKSETNKNESRKEFILGNGSEPSSLDFHRISANADIRVSMALFEGLVQEHPLEEGVVSPGVARSWEIDASGKRYTFQLRADAKWSDGLVVTAQHFVDGARRVLDPDFGGPLADFFDFVVGARGYREGDLEHFADVGIKAVDDSTLVMELENPTPFFLQILKRPVFFPWRAEIFAANPRIPQVVNGPFQVEEWVPNEFLTVRRQAHYGGQIIPKVDAVTFLPITNTATEERAFLTGDIHFTNGVPAGTQGRLRGSGDPTYREDAHLATAYVIMNTRDERLSDRRLRQALSYAIDRRAIVEHVIKMGQAATSFTPDKLPDYTPGSLLGFDPDKAKRLLMDWEATHGKLDKLTLSTSTSSNPTRVTEALQGMWSEYLGLDVELIQSEFRVYLNSLNAGEYQLGFLAWYGDYADPYTFLNVFRSTAPTNRARWNAEAYDALLDKSLETSGASRRVAMESAEQLLLTEMPISPVYWVSQPHRVAENVTGWPAKLLEFRPFTAVDIIE